ncbi:hypothetical protein IBL26_18860 [Roseomonas aerophila]|uniref:WYL domain-containing protein n=1 Tax=Teichococcus aerophilus TaxID=1224513 RepID=A0ABR7RRY4_9PROT|nr:hypothetical protein [Pseudoroseomonas aerophila]MBC9208915.1 hypothetical protein [Pseudoroseomonas aerophila]
MVSARRPSEAVAGSLPNRTTTVTMGAATHPMENLVLDFLLGCLILTAVVGGLRLMIRAERKKADVGPAEAPAGALGASTEEAADLPVLGTSALLIRYRDSSNQESERRITPKKVRGMVSSGQLQISHIEAYCHSRKRARTFKPERILQAADAETGEVLVLPNGLADWLQPRISA